MTSRWPRLFSGLVRPAIAPVLALGAALALAAVARGAGTGPRLTWFGQSCFLLETAGGARVVMDPIPGGLGYTPPTGLKADVVTVSHEHPDHSNVALVEGKPKVLRGLTEDKKGWVKINQKVKDVAIRSVGVYHDDQMGKLRGLDTVFVFETGGLKVAHLGDLGHLLTDEQLAAIGPVDVLLIPVGGGFTIDAAQATRVIAQLKPKQIVLPMHYRTDVSTIKQLAPIDDFLQGKVGVRRETSNSIALGNHKGPAEIVVLNYK